MDILLLGQLSSRSSTPWVDYEGEHEGIRNSGLHITLAWAKLHCVGAILVKHSRGQQRGLLKGRSNYSAYCQSLRLKLYLCKLGKVCVEDNMHVAKQLRSVIIPICYCSHNSHYVDVVPLLCSAPSGISFNLRRSESDSASVKSHSESIALNDITSMVTLLLIRPLVKFPPFAEEHVFRHLT